MARCIGIDLHRNRFTVCKICGNGQTYHDTVEMDDLSKFVRQLRPDDQIAVEMTTNTRFFIAHFKDIVKRVVIVDAGKFKIISESTKKTDRHDAEQLAYFLSKDMLPELRMKSPENEKLHSLCQTRDKLVKQRTQLKNKINNIFASWGILLKKEEMSSEKALDRVLEYDIDDVVNLELEVLVEQIRSINKSVKKLEQKIDDEGGSREEHKILTSIKGIGSKGASILMSVIGDVNDFADDKKLCAYFGLVPKVSNSNEKEHSGKITKRGSKLGRTTLVQCGLIAKKYSPYLLRFHERVKRSRGGAKANVALARKLLSILYRALKERIVFTDFPNFEYVRLDECA